MSTEDRIDQLIAGQNSLLARLDQLDNKLDVAETDERLAVMIALITELAAFTREAITEGHRRDLEAHLATSQDIRNT